MRDTLRSLLESRFGRYRGVFSDLEEFGEPENATLRAIVSLLLFEDADARLSELDAAVEAWLRDDRGELCVCGYPKENPTDTHAFGCRWARERDEARS